jgi:hypothetical protein
VQINFIDLAQISPNFAKNIRSLTTCVNKKKSKKKFSDYIPPAVKEEEEILATKATVESNTTKVTVKSNIATADQLSPQLSS